MCGICGFNWSDKVLIKRMTDRLIHRGPDSEGFFVSPDISLGNRRLKIIDLSKNGDQPIYNEDRTICVVHNGEVYNFPELRKELEYKGHKFYSNTDTEVIVHMYEEYGIKCVNRFIGMYAFAIWDGREKTLFIVRDRIGIKPLYYYYDGRNFIFGSEIKSILEHPSVIRKVNYQSLYYYLGYEFVPGPLTMFENIYKLQPGCYLVYKDGDVDIHRYWDLEFNTNKKGESYYIEGIVDCLDRAIKRWIISDVPVGVFLSGGLDSTTVLSFMRRYITGPLKAFSIGYPDKSFSEFEYATYAARYFDVEQHILVIDKITHEDIEKSIWHLDEPMTDLSTIPFYLICKKAREDVIVAMSGEGGDEVFVGYDRFKASKFYNMYYKNIPRFFRSRINKIVDRFPDQEQKKGFINIVKRFVDGTKLPEEGLHMRWQYFSNPVQDSLLYKEDFKKMVDMEGFKPIKDLIQNCNSMDRLDKEIYIDTRFTMPDSVLMKVDKMSMAVSLEVRVPFLDHEVIEFSASIPSDLKLKGFTTKAIFRKAMKNYLPPKILYRGKQGYSIPAKNWLRNELREYMIDLLNSSSIVKECLNLSYVNTLIHQHLSKTHNHNHILWALINLAIWHNKFFR